MRIKAEAKVVTFGDLKAAVKAFEAQGFKDGDIINPPSKWLPPESSDTRDSLSKTFTSLAKAMDSEKRHLGMALWMCKDLSE